MTIQSALQQVFTRQQIDQAVQAEKLETEAMTDKQRIERLELELHNLRNQLLGPVRKVPQATDHVRDDLESKARTLQRRLDDLEPHRAGGVTSYGVIDGRDQVKPQFRELKTKLQADLASAKQALQDYDNAPK